MTTGSYLAVKKTPCLIHFNYRTSRAASRRISLNASL